MTNEHVVLIAEIMFWLGMILSSPFLWRVSYQIVRYLKVVYYTKSEVVLIDENGNELTLILKKGTTSKGQLLEHLRSSLDVSK